MAEVLIQATAIAAGGIVSAGSILIVILLLISKQGFYNGLAYVVGYVGGYTIIGLVSLGFGQLTTTNNYGTSTSGAIISLLLGLLFLSLAFRNWRKGAGSQPPLPGFFTALDQIRPGKSFGFGLLVSIVNFKNLAIYLSAVSVVAVSGLSQTNRLIGLAAVLLVFCSTVILPLVIYFVVPRQAESVLKAMKDWLEKNTRPLSIGVLLVFGCLFLARGIRSLWYI